MSHDSRRYVESLNLYEYVKSMPLFRFDPLGLSSKDKRKVCCEGVKIVTNSFIYDHCLTGKYSNAWKDYFIFEEIDIEYEKKDPFSKLLNACKCHFKNRKPEVIAVRAEFGKCNVCGPDITEALGKLRDQVGENFNKEDYWGQLFLCSGKWQTDSWDIGYLHEIESNYLPGCMTGRCEETVEVNGKCYNAHAVNYYLWGVTSAFCLEGKAVMNTGINWARISGDYDCKKKWAEAGYAGSTHILGCSLDCKTGQCSEKVNKFESYKWEKGLFIIGISWGQKNNPIH